MNAATKPTANKPAAPPDGKPKKRKRLKGMVLVGAYDGMHIFPPGSLVKVNRQEETRFIQQHRVNPDEEITATVIPTGKVPPNHFISYG